MTTSYESWKPVIDGARKAQAEINRIIAAGVEKLEKQAEKDDLKNTQPQGLWADCHTCGAYVKAANLNKHTTWHNRNDKLGPF